MVHRDMFKQFILYFFVGGAAAIVEWSGFFLLNGILSFHYIAAAILSFALSTLSNWFLGRRFVFKKNDRTISLSSEITAIYVVSTMGLILNLIFMYVFIDKAGLQAMPSKVIATGIVFFWNFVIRKVLIYKI